MAAIAFVMGNVVPESDTKGVANVDVKKGLNKRVKRETHGSRIVIVAHDDILDDDDDDEDDFTGY